eukprot:6198357-Pleurochrysis_carterae.AAC.1
MQLVGRAGTGLRHFKIASPVPLTYRFTIEQPLKGRARSELVVKADSTVQRTPELAYTTSRGSGASVGAGAGARLRGGSR